MTRFPPIPDADLDEDQQRMSERATHTGPYPAFLRAPRLWEALQHVRVYLAKESVLDARLREVIILATARHWRCTSAFASHRGLAIKAGLDEALVTALAANETELAGLDSREDAALLLVRTLLAQGGVDDSQHAAALELLGERALVELVGLTGFFTTICLTINLAGVHAEAPFAGAPGTYSASGHNPDD
ncbi:carboxymuconolactone decarboxylase family protein [Novosphingobium sp. BL-52-GroH]|uniref:carboxymuconolactone decarboxylase family protein n=1 Tax=Novosphingobium sp. BL-52-GroH TaxID=3349877 RepID=UPI00384FDCC2